MAPPQQQQFQPPLQQQHFQQQQQPPASQQQQQLPQPMQTEFEFEEELAPPSFRALSMAAPPQRPRQQPTSTAGGVAPMQVSGAGSTALAATKVRVCLLLVKCPIVCVGWSRLC